MLQIRIPHDILALVCAANMESILVVCGPLPFAMKCTCPSCPQRKLYIWSMSMSVSSSHIDGLFILGCGKSRTGNSKRRPIWSSIIYDPLRLPSGNFTYLWQMAIDIVGFPIQNGGSFHSCVNVYQRVSLLFFFFLYPSDLPTAVRSFCTRMM